MSIDGPPAGPPARQLEGLVVLRGLARGQTGSSRPILHAEAPLRDLGIRLHFCAARTVLHFLYSLARTRRLRYDLILFNGLASLSSRSRFGYSAWRLARAIGLPTFVYWHETDWVLDQQAQDDPAGARRVARVAGDPTTVHLAVSEACSQSLQKRFGEVEPIVVYNCTGVPAPFDRPVRPAEPPLVVNLASIQARKGTDLFVETAIKVCQQHPTVEFMWLGGGRPFGTWQEEIKRAGLDDRILFPGYVDSGHLILRRASVLFLSSRDDPFPLSVLEAMCLGRTVVTFDVGGAPEALAGLGHLIPAFDTDRAASTILTCLSKGPGELVQPELHDRYKANYTPTQFARRLDRVLRDRVG
jgi:glycosyltransferase involved in cell wall biosynthesis